MPTIRSLARSMGAHTSARSRTIGGSSKTEVMKYIVFQQSGIEVPVVFTCAIEHRDLHVDRGQPLSAGFVELADGQWKTFGFSDSLDLTPRTLDAGLIAHWMSMPEPFRNEFYAPPS